MIKNKIAHMVKFSFIQEHYVCGSQGLRGFLCIYFFLGCFQKWLERKNLEEAELKARTMKLGHYLTEKIQDINKKVKKAK